MRPAGALLGVFDFFAVLVPGASLVFAVLILFGTPTCSACADGTASWALFLAASYVVGHLLGAVGSRFLDSWYDDGYVVKKRENGDPLLDCVRQLRDADLRELANKEGAVPGNIVNAFDWALSAIRDAESAGMGEVERLLAGSKLFRGLAVAAGAAWLLVLVGTAVATIGAVRGGQELGFDRVALASLLALPVLSVTFYHRFAKLRWDATCRIYEFFLLVCGRKVR